MELSSLSVDSSGVRVAIDVFKEFVSRWGGGVIVGERVLRSSGLKVRCALITLRQVE